MFTTRYPRYTPQMNLHAHDQTNITTCDRTLAVYSNWLFGDDITLTERLIALSKRLGRPLIVLDSGCGKGHAARDLICTPIIRDYIKKVIGISMHHFHSSEQIQQAHPNKFTYHVGTTQSVLSKAFGQVDVILDIWGAFAYSPDKAALLHQYHDCLAPHGQLFAFQRIPRHTINTVVQTDAEEYPFFDFLARYPGFSYTHGNAEQQTLLYEKQQSHFPLPPTHVASVSAQMTRTNPAALSIPLAQAQAGNAVVPEQAVLVVESERQLKPKPY